MTEAMARQAAERADLIVNGYAFTRDGRNCRILNLRTGKAALVDDRHVILETSMDDIDASLALRYLSMNEQFMEPLRPVPCSHCDSEVPEWHAGVLAGRENASDDEFEDWDVVKEELRGGSVAH